MDDDLCQGFSSLLFMLFALYSFSVERFYPFGFFYDKVFNEADAKFPWLFWIGFWSSPPKCLCIFLFILMISRVLQFIGDN